MVGPEHPLPISEEFGSPECYIDSLLDFVASSHLLRTLCGGVHVLDFFTRTPDLYETVLPSEWRSFFRAHNIMDLLDLIMRVDLDAFNHHESQPWRGGPSPPDSLVHYLSQVRRHSMTRHCATTTHDNLPRKTHNLATKVALGMKVKKVHEVAQFSSYIDTLIADIAASRNEHITHLVDFGSGQNYLGRALASEPYNKHIIAVESRQHNIDGARDWDIKANLAPKKKVMRNKKEWREEYERLRAQKSSPSGPRSTCNPNQDVKGDRGFFARNKTPPPEPTQRATLHISAKGVGTIQYVEHYIKDGDLSRVVDQIVDQDTIRKQVNSDLIEPDSVQGIPFVQGDLLLKDSLKAADPRLMVISLHSCGNLVHHGIRSLLMNPTVSAVALIGCCYNLITERLGPPTYKLPTLRSNHPRLEKTSTAYDPHGFPMSERLCNYESSSGKGLRLNITARMMAVQAPYNWGQKDSELFFKRHFYRALLQRIFLDCGIVEEPDQEHVETNDGSPLGWSGATAPIIIGGLKKSCYNSFVDYVRGALEKLTKDSERGALFEEKMRHLSDEDLNRYEHDYQERGKELSVIWSLMAFSASVVEAVIVSDRWLYLKEHEEVAAAWVEPVFEYSLSPRNLVVVGIKR